MSSKLDPFLKISSDKDIYFFLIHFGSARELFQYLLVINIIYKQLLNAFCDFTLDFISMNPILDKKKKYLGKRDIKF